MKTLILTIFLGIACMANGCVNVKLGDDDRKEKSAPRSSSPQTDTDWKGTAADVAGQIFLGTDQNAVFYAFDTLAHPNEPVELTCRLQKAKFLDDVPGATIGYYLDSRLVDIAETDLDGFANISWTPSAAGDYLFTVKIAEIPKNQNQDLLRVSPVPLLVAARDKTTPFVVIDLDHTVVDSSFFRVLLGGGEPMVDSVDVTNKIAQKYSLIYLTHRPDLMTHRSKSWLRKHGYPPAPLLVSELKQALGSSGKFKTAKIAALNQAFTDIKIGIGDKLSDAQAYVDNGMTAYLIPHYKDKPKDMRNMAREIRDLRGHGRLHVVANWRQIEDGLFQGKKYPPGPFADWLEKQARQLEDLDDD
jgi:hypothetical protein